MKTFVFPGQGSQKKGMGDTLFDDFYDLTSKADDILGYSIKDLCLRDPFQQLNQTQFTQPAIFTVNALTYLKKVDQEDVKPDFVAGHSVGEYNALFASGAFNFEHGLRLVKKRGELMAKSTGGGMAAVIGLTEYQINNIIKEYNFNITTANYNNPSQIVISGLKDDIMIAQPIFESLGARLYVVLNVSGAFHTHYMNPAKEDMSNYLDNFIFSKLQVPVISNLNARPYQQERIKATLTDQINHPVKWTESIQYLLDIGGKEMVFEEIGQGRTLTGLINVIKREYQFPVENEKILMRSYID